MDNESSTSMSSTSSMSSTKSKDEFTKEHLITLMERLLGNGNKVVEEMMPSMALTLVRMYVISAKIFENNEIEKDHNGVTNQPRLTQVGDRDLTSPSQRYLADSARKKRTSGSSIADRHTHHISHNRVN